LALEAGSNPKKVTPPSPLIGAARRCVADVLEETLLEFHACTVMAEDAPAVLAAAGD